MQRAFGLAVWLVLVTASVSFGQATTSGTGAINGRVTDGTGAVMPGVTITLTSPALMGARTAVTDENGQYRFTAVPPGSIRCSSSWPVSRRCATRASASTSASPAPSTPR